MTGKIGPLVDLHEDISYYYVNQGSGLNFPVADFAQDVAGRHGDIPKYRKAGASVIFSAIFPLPSTYSPRIASQLSSGYGFSLRAHGTYGALPLALEHFKTYYRLVKQHSVDLTFLLEERQLEELTKTGRVHFILSLESSEAVEDVEDVELFYRLGLRSLQLTWNYDTRYAATCMSKRDYGLTGEGEDLIQLCNERGIMVDLSHASKKTVLDACAVSHLPVIISHANYARINQHKRNVDDDMLEAIVSSGGVIGFTFIPTTISSKGRPTVSDVANHILEVYNRFGDDLLAIGTDYFGLIDALPPEGLESIDKISNLWDVLLDRGMGERSLQKLAGQNAIRVIQEHAKRWH